MNEAEGIQFGDNEEINEHQEEQELNNEFKIWKKNAPYLYDTVITHLLEWPSLTVQWLPCNESTDDSDFTKHKIILGTQTSEDESNYLMIAQVKLPKHTNIKDTKDNSYQRKEGQSKHSNSLQIETRILHEGDVNKAMYMPQKYNIIATKTAGGDVLIFDYAKHPPKPSDSDHINYQLRLKGHSDQGYGLSWNHKNEGQLLSASDDKLICMWDINSAKELGGEMQAQNTFRFHTSAVNVDFID